MQCILCQNNNTIVTQKISKFDICRLYQRNFNINIAHLITSDMLYMYCQECDIRFFVCEDGVIPTGDEIFYNQLNQLPWYYFETKHEYHYAKNFIQTESKVLEVGCGKGAFAKFLPPTAHYVGLEFSTEAQKMASLQGIHIKNTSIQDYALYHKEEFDVSCSFQVLEHVSNPYTFLQSQIACLKPIRGGGYTRKLAITHYSCA